MRRPGLWILILVAISLVISLVVAKNQKVEKVEGGPCLVDGNCLKSQRCFVIPKGDGFATDGRCVDTCRGDLACPPQWRCEAVYEAGGYLVPKGAKGATAQVVEVCLAGARQE